MVRCVYYKKGSNEPLTYDQLVNDLSSKGDLDNELDVLYNLATVSEQDILQQTFKDIKDQNADAFTNLSNSISSIEDDISIAREQFKMSVLDFIDDPRFVKSDGSRFLPQMSDEDFKKNRSSILQSEHNLSKEDADALVEKEFPKWKQQRNDGIIIHYALKFSNIDSTTTLQSKLNDLIDLIPNSDLAERVKMFQNDENLLKQLLNISKSIVKTRPLGSKVIQTIPISSEVTLEDGSKITVVDSIDQVVIDSAGYVKVYKYKITEENPSNWNESKSPKVEKYRYELAFIKAMLENSKLFSKNKLKKISLNIFAVQIKYQKDFGENDTLLIKEIVPNSVDLQMDMTNDGKSKMVNNLQVARQFIQPKIEIANIDEAVQKANAHMERVWVGKNIRVEATVKSVEQWIQDNIDRRIIKCECTPGQNENHWKIILPGKGDIYIKEDSDPENNKEMFEVISNYLKELEEKNDTTINSLQRGIEQAVKSGNLDSRDFRGFKGSQANIKSMLDPYFQHTTDAEGNKIFKWEFVKDSILNDYGILLFKNLKSGQIDVITLTNLNLSSKIEFKYGRTNLAGSYMSNIDSHQLPSTWGNIYAMKTLILLNYVSSNLKGKFGNLKVITTFDNGKSQTFNIKELVSNYYNPLMSIVEKNTTDGAFENNFSNAEFIDSYEALLNELKNIIRANGVINTTIDNFEEQVSYLESLNGDGAKIAALIDLAKSIYDQFDPNMSSQKMADNYYNRLVEGSNNYYTVELLVKISDIINQLRKDTIGPPQKIERLTKMFMPTSGVSNNHFKIVRRYFNETSQRINTEAYNIGLDINKITQELYKDAGYSQIQNRIIGNQLHIFKNMYESGNSMLFKNPYDMSNSLQSYERKFLKKALMIFAKYRYINSGKQFSYSLNDIDSDNYKEFVQKNSAWYFCVPLKKASNSSDLQSGYSFSDVAQTVNGMLHDPKLWARKFLDDKALDAYLKEHKANSDITQLSVTNYFSYGEPDISSETFNNNARGEHLSNHPDTRFFEHNVENLLRDFTFESVRAQNMNKMMFACKLVLTQLTLSGKINNNLKDFESEIKYIEDFLKVNVFNIPLMESSELAIAGYLLPVRKLVSRMLVAGNIASSIRDGFEGFSQIIARAVTKYGGTNIAAGDVMRAYSIVTKEMMTKLPLASLVSQLCIKYRMSNIDVSNVAEGMKTEKGIFNYDNMLYATLRKPDFLNRMTLFVAKCIHDGTWDAFSLNKEGVLEYDWKKDKRFNLLAKNDKSNLDEFNKQKGMFYSLMRIWNEEHPNNQVTETLPMPYTEKEMDAFHALSDNIWGAYDKSNKALGEHSLLMMTFGMFMTWMNGQIKNYYTPMQESSDRVKFIQMRNGNGQLLFYTEDGQITTEDTGLPAYAQQPIFVQGILQTLQQMYKVIKDGGSWDEVFGTKENPSESNRENMKKLGTDITITLIYLTLIRAALEALRDKQKEITDPHDVITNGICEVLYKGMYNSWDGFAGPLNLIKYLGSQTNPPIYTESIGMAKDLFNVVVGDITILSFGSRHFAPIRAFKETIKSNEKE